VPNLTPKQEAFCRIYVELGNASEAYRRAYEPKRMSSNALHVQASKMLSAPKIALFIDELKAQHANRHRVTVDGIAKMLLDDREFAQKEGKPSACVAATMGLAKLYGYLIEKRELTGKDGADLIPARTDDEARNMLADRIAEALARTPKQGQAPTTH
jgi:succinate dehydrogenase/fumarate reductase flavoprotein subunit